MGVSWRVVDWLRAQGYDAKHLRDEALERLEDADIFSKARVRVYTLQSIARISSTVDHGGTHRRIGVSKTMADSRELERTV